jgi:hypothetical protein
LDARLEIGGRKGRMKLPELNSALFVRETHVNEYGHLLELDNADLSTSNLVNALIKHAVGWCSGERLCFRPIDETMVGLMCEDKDFNKFWFHLSRNTFDKVFGEKEN